ncbi:RNA polymerase sigma-54 factor [Erythrobacteraceae bacterium CFH 75059]|uniref:RNA polymerase factor sigma-54 n=1 Tax=Qipengyuania thermophila TaxID=2509361 RepID=UPI00101FE8DB|nr:RNA polymerase factor sigma-54 [Qipengyuania thermophila]TCD06880.1 RNA polymerase sigma-54 factor [Erythrobacteraceae bacterium CFH 75059]
MALSARLEMRQSQTLVMSPQMQQAVKLLALSNLELETFIAQSLSANPLLEVGDTAAEPAAEPDAIAAEPSADGFGTGHDALDLEETWNGGGRDDGAWGSDSYAGGADAPAEPDARAASLPTLSEHLAAQIAGAAFDRREAQLAMAVIGELDEAGYLATPLDALAREHGVPVAEMERALKRVQSLDPPGIGARTLAECLALQARDADRYDPCMARLIDNLDLVARGEVERLKRLCEVDDEDLADMLAELRRYDPKPGCRFGGCGDEAIVPDVLVLPRGADWEVRLNEATLPRLVVNRPYYLELRNGCPGKAARRWLDEQLQEANWIIRALDQRQKTILKTAAAIIRHQAGFFRQGVAAMRPLTLREVAQDIAMHESTVSRVAANKYLSCPFGTFELRYFFSSGVAAEGDGEASSEAVKARIRALIAAEAPDAVLSDDALVAVLRTEGYDLARRTVAKYREALGLGSSVQRRRRHRLAGLA